MFSSHATASSVSSWISPHYQNHRLVGKIWSTRTRQFISSTQLFHETSRSKYLLLGETHTNIDHHLLQAKVVSQSKTIGQLTDQLHIVFEMITPDIAVKFQRYRKLQPTNSAGFAKVLKWKERGWGRFRGYDEIFSAALRLRSKIVAGNIDRGMIRLIARKGISALKAELVDRWALDIAYTNTQRARINSILYDSHCKLVPKSALSPMRRVQRARDGSLAAAMLGAPVNSKVILIAGTGHVRRDIGVPRILSHKARSSKTVSIAFIEVTPERKKPQDYEPKSADKLPVYDYLYFTPRAEIKDHCAELKKRFQKQKATK